MYCLLRQNSIQYQRDTAYRRNLRIHYCHFRQFAWSEQHLECVYRALVVGCRFTEFESMQMDEVGLVEYGAFISPVDGPDSCHVCEKSECRATRS